ncbi:MAG: DUF4296 domain-containing protein [Flavobacterium sp.]
MKKIIVLLAILVFLAGCNETSVEKPKNLIPEEKMVEILYDMALFEAITVSQPASIQERELKPDTFIFKKYQVDSLQFSTSNKFYASDVNLYAKIFDKVGKRLESKLKETDSLIKKGVNIGESKVDEKKKEKKLPLKLDIERARFHRIR